MGSDSGLAIKSPHNVDFNPRSPCGERLRYEHSYHQGIAKFQSTLPVWGATSGGMWRTMDRLISIHAPRVGSDVFAQAVQRRNSKFQSTLPVWGATPRNCCVTLSVRFQSTLPVWGATHWCNYTILLTEFQSTLPVWGATIIYNSVLPLVTISIHAPRVGSDSRPPSP